MPFSQEMLKVDELQCNPFAARIVELFSEDGSGEINFQKFINIFSVFSPRATVETKMVWAFSIWDFDGEWLPSRLFPHGSRQQMMLSRLPIL